jgi:hypothetical protein
MSKAIVLTDRFDRALLYATHVHGGVAVGYGIAKMQMSAELADLSANIDAKWTALKSELAAAQAELEELKVLHADKARS